MAPFYFISILASHQPDKSACCQAGQPAWALAPRSFPRQAEVRQQWRAGAVPPKAHLSRHCRQHRTAREPQRGAPRAATMVPRTAARTAPSGRRAGVTETARSPRPQSQWARPADSASRHRQEAKVSRQRIIKALCCSSTAWSEQKQRDGDSLAPRRGSESELSFTANPSTRGFGRGSSTNQARDLKVQYTR